MPEMMNIDVSKMIQINSSFSGSNAADVSTGGSNTSFSFNDTLKNYSIQSSSNSLDSGANSTSNLTNNNVPITNNFFIASGLGSKSSDNYSIINSSSVNGNNQTSNVGTSQDSTLLNELIELQNLLQKLLPEENGTNVNVSSPSNDITSNPQSNKSDSDKNNNNIASELQALMQVLNNISFSQNDNLNIAQQGSGAISDLKNDLNNLIQTLKSDANLQMPQAQQVSQDQQGLVSNFVNNSASEFVKASALKLAQLSNSNNVDNQQNGNISASNDVQSLVLKIRGEINILLNSSNQAGTGEKVSISNSSDPIFTQNNQVNSSSQTDAPVEQKGTTSVTSGIVQGNNGVQNNANSTNIKDVTTNSANNTTNSTTTTNNTTNNTNTNIVSAITKNADSNSTANTSNSINNTTTNTEETVNSNYQSQINFNNNNNPIKIQPQVRQNEAFTIQNSTPQLNNNDLSQNQSNSKGNSGSFDGGSKFLNSLIDSNSNDKISKAAAILSQFNTNITNNNETNSVNALSTPIVNSSNFTTDIIQSIKYMDENNIKDLTVKITPENLGEVVIKITSDGGIMKASITATNKDTYNLLNSNLNQINSSLSNNDIKFQNVSVNISNGDTTFFSNNNFGSNKDDNRQGNFNGKHGIASIDEVNGTALENDSYNDNSVNALA